MSAAAGQAGLTQKRYSAIVQLILARVREFYRQPEAIFWVYGFPLLMATALGVAFRNRPVDRIAVDIIDGPGAAEAAQVLTSAGRFDPTVGEEAVCRRRLRTGRTDLVVVIVSPGGAGAPRNEYLYDFTRPESALARSAVDDALQRGAGRADPIGVSDRSFEEPGGRYIDFLIPGLLGMSLMGGGLWGGGFVIVDMRIRKLLKRFLATPMKKSQFMAAIMVSRLLFLIPEVLVLLVFARFAFQFENHGSLAAVVVLVLLGSICFAGIGLLVASRAKTIEAVSGLMNLIMLPMWILSGIFFSAERFPETFQPVIRVIPLTLLNDALRGVMLDGKPLAADLARVGGLAAWGVICFVIALKIFRWR